MREHMDGPATGGAAVLNRLIYLQTVKGLEGLDADAMRYLALETDDVLYRAGEAIHTPDNPVSDVHFLIDGKVEVKHAGTLVMTAVAPARFGFLPALCNKPTHWDARAIEPCTALKMPASRLLSLLRMNSSFVETGIAQLAQRMLHLQAELSSRGLMTRNEPEASPIPKGTLGPVERLTRIRVGPYRAISVRSLFLLAESLKEVRFSAGTQIWRKGDRSDWGLHIVHGVVSCGAGPTAFRMGASSAVGELDAYAKLSRGYDALAETDVVALRVDRDAFLDVAERRFELVSGFLSFISEALLRLNLRLGQAVATGSEYGNLNDD